MTPTRPDPDFDPSPTSTPEQGDKRTGVVKSLAPFNTQFKVKESCKLIVPINVRTLGDKSRKILATKAAVNILAGALN